MLCPEQKAVVADEDEQRKKDDGGPLLTCWRSLTAGDRPKVEDEASDEETQGGEEKRRHFVDADADGEKSGPPDEVDNRERKEGLPRGAMGLGGHMRVVAEN